MTATFSQLLIGSLAALYNGRLAGLVLLVAIIIIVATMPPGATG